MVLQYCFLWFFDSIKLLLNKTNKNLDFNEYKQYKQLLELLISAFFRRSKQVFKIFYNRKKYAVWFFQF